MPEVCATMYDTTNVLDYAMTILYYERERVRNLAFQMPTEADHTDHT